MFAKVCVVLVMLAYVGSCLALPGGPGAPGASVKSDPIHPRVIPPLGYRHVDLHAPVLHSAVLPPLDYSHLDLHEPVLHSAVLPPLGYRHVGLHEPLVVNPYHHAHYNPLAFDEHNLGYYPWSRFYHI